MTSNKHFAHTFGPHESWPQKVITPIQTHSNKIVEIVTSEENLENCDGIWTRDFSKILGIRTADCAPIVFMNEEKFGILHAGWRGICGDICEQMINIFSEKSPRAPFKKGRVKSPPEDSSPIKGDLGDCAKIWCGPILPKFEIQKDDCWEQIRRKFGEEFFTYPPQGGESKIIFNFKGAIEKIFVDKNLKIEFDERSTLEEKNLASWRRDRNHLRNLTVVGRF